MGAATNSAAALLQDLLGCDAERAQAAVAALVAAGWSPPPTAPAVAAEVTSAAALINPDAALTAHTDGACSGNPGPGGWSVVFSQGGRVVAEHSGALADTTNDRTELTAIREAIQRAPEGASLTVLTDSVNAIGWLERGWKRKDAGIAALCADIDRLLSARSGAVVFNRVRGHRGDVLNWRADRLATAAIPPGGTVAA